MAKELLGTAVTDENGIATFTYTGQGRGKMNIVAESGELVSETYDVLDCQFLDVATTGKKNENYYSNTGNVSIQVTDTGAVFSSNNSNTANLLPNIGNTPSSIADVRDFEAPFCVEIDIVEFTGTTHQLGFNSADDGNIGRNFSQLNITAPTHLTVKVGEEINGIKYCNYYIGNNITPTWGKQINGTSPFAVVLQSIATYYWKFRNFKIYPI